MASKWRRNAPQMLQNGVLDSHGRPRGPNMDQSLDLGPIWAQQWSPQMRENRIICSKKQYIISLSILHDFWCRKWRPQTLKTSILCKRGIDFSKIAQSEKVTKKAPQREPKVVQNHSESSTNDTLKINDFLIDFRVPQES